MTTPTAILASPSPTPPSSGARHVRAPSGVRTLGTKAFDVLQGGYHWIGYPLYLLLGGGTLAGMGVGVLVPFRRIPSLRRVAPQIQRRLALASATLLALFIALVVWLILSSDLKLLGA